MAMNCSTGVSQPASPDSMTTKTMNSHIVIDMDVSCGEGVGGEGILRGVDTEGSGCIIHGRLEKALSIEAKSRR